MTEDIQADLIERCAGMLARAKAGEMTGLCCVEYNGSKINAYVRHTDHDEGMKAPAYLGFVLGRQIDWDDDDKEQD